MICKETADLREEDATG